MEQNPISKITDVLLGKDWKTAIEIINEPHDDSFEKTMLIVLTHSAIYQECNYGSKLAKEDKDNLECLLEEIRAYMLNPSKPSNLIKTN